MNFRRLITSKINNGIKNYVTIMVSVFLRWGVSNATVIQSPNFKSTTSVIQSPCMLMAKHVSCIFLLKEFTTFQRLWLCKIPVGYNTSIIHIAPGVSEYTMKDQGILRTVCEQ